MSSVVINNGTIQRVYFDEIKLEFGSFLKRMNDEEFLEFCRDNDDVLIEMNAEGDLEIVPGTGGLTGKKNSYLNRKVGNWAEETNNGEVFDAQTFFRLNNSAKRMPDVAWVKSKRWNSLTREEQEGVIPFAPDFVIELRSKSDVLKDLQEKMQEYVENGVSLGWLISPQTKQVFVYRRNEEVEILENPTEILGEPLLKGFTLNLKKIWE
ncbi:MAG: Uma2 family endonuclease [Aridibacter sp.]